MVTFIKKVANVIPELLDILPSLYRMSYHFSILFTSAEQL